MTDRPKMIINVLFLIGIVVAIVGWFFDKAKSFDWLMLKIAPDYVFAQRALDDLKRDSKIVLTDRHQGFRVLITRWPNLKNPNAVKYIGRSSAFLAFGAQVRNDIQMIAYDIEKTEIPERWNMSDAAGEIERIVETRLFRIGAILFWSGIVISVASHAISLMSKQ